MRPKYLRRGNRGLGVIFFPVFIVVFIFTLMLSPRLFRRPQRMPFRRCDTRKVGAVEVALWRTTALSEASSARLRAVLSAPINEEADETLEGNNPEFPS